MALVIGALLLCALVVGLRAKPAEFPLVVSDHPGPWQRYDAKADVEVIDSWSCARVFVPQSPDVKKRKGIVRT